MSNSLFSSLLSGLLRGGQWRFPIEEMWRTPSETCWGASAPPAPTWAPPSSKSWAGEPPSSASHNSPAKCSLSRECTCPHTQVAWHALCYVDFKRAIGGEWCNTYRRKTPTPTQTPLHYLSTCFSQDICCQKSVAFKMKFALKHFPRGITALWST